MTHKGFLLSLATLTPVCVLFIALAAGSSPRSPEADLPFVLRIEPECKRQFESKYDIDNCVRRLWARYRFEEEQGKLNSAYQRSHGR
jgi:hypothetical protein